MNQLIRQAQNEKGFSQIVLLGIVIVLILAGVGSFLVLREKKASTKLVVNTENVKVQDFGSEFLVRPLPPQAAKIVRTTFRISQNL